MRYVDAEGVVLTREEHRAGFGKGRVRVILDEFEESKVDQSKLAETDLNVLVQRLMRGDPVPEFAPLEFGDVSGITSFQEMQDKLLTVQNAFATLPAHVREHFRNSPVVFADAFSDPNQLGMLLELGVLVKPEAQSEAPPPEAVVPKVEPPANKPPEGAR